MSPFDVPDLPSHFHRLLGECRELYLSSARRIADEHPQLLAESVEKFTERMDDLHRGLLVKIFVSICESDRRWSQKERFLAEVLVFHLWSQWLEGDALQEAISVMSKKAMTLKWYAVIRPFDQIAPLRNRIGELETLVVRIANTIARADGPMKPVETAQVKSIQNELNVHLRDIPIDDPEEREQANEARIETIKKILHDANRLPDAQTSATATQEDKRPDRSGRVAIEKETEASGKEEQAKPSPDQLEKSLAELDRLIGLENIKHEVRTLTNFLKVQCHRQKADLPTANLSLHMVFGGNPGTGKTTVARIVGKIFGAMGVLKKGHLIETDRSGLVAEYAGQTGPKTNSRIDEALDGVLFIDEAYTLISAKGEDPFGHEAVQTLLKRMEDDRTRLVVILAGYPQEMRTLLRSNPGLSSRFSRKLEFMDYTPLELAKIFGLMCKKNRYELRTATRAKVMLGLDWLYDRRDRHFGNGRASRNLFEHSIRLMANRIAEIAELSVEQLSTLEAEDIEFKNAPADLSEPLGDDRLRFHIQCSECDHAKDIPMKYLGKQIICPKCKHSFAADWGEVVDAKAKTG